MTLSRVDLSDPVSLRGYAHPLRMTLIGLLRRQGPMTATQAAEQLGESVPSCSFHLRQLAKYGLAERVPGADGRERPWRATASVTTWDEGTEDPEMRAATDQLSAVQLARYVRRAEDFLARRAEESTSWRAVTGFSDAVLHVTPDELAELTRRMDALLAEYDGRVTDPAARPAGTRPVALFQMLMPIEDQPAPASPAPPAPGGDRPGEDGPGDRGRADD